MFFLEPCDESFRSRARPDHVYENRTILSAPAGDVFDVLAGLVTGAEEQWFPEFATAEWLTPPPHGVGSVRDYRLTYARLVEHFIVWERPRRLAFFASGFSLPIVRRFLEHYELEPLDGGRTAMRWQVCYEPRWSWMAVIHPAVRRLFARDFAKATANLERYFDGASAPAGPPAWRGGVVREACRLKWPSR